MKEIAFPIPMVHFVDGPKRGEFIEARARRLIAHVNYGRRGWRTCVYDLQYHEEQGFFYYTFRGFLDDPTWQEKFPAPGLPGWVDVPVRRKFPALPENSQEEVQSIVRKYTCEICGGEFEFDKNWTEEDALQEYSDNFPGNRRDDLVQVCDDCYKEFMEWNKTR